MGGVFNEPTFTTFTCEEYLKETLVPPMSLLLRTAAETKKKSASSVLQLHDVWYLSGPGVVTQNALGKRVLFFFDPAPFLCCPPPPPQGPILPI